MSVVSIFGRDAEAEARAHLKVAAGRKPQAMSEADRLLHNILEGGDVIGRDDAGRVVMLLAIEPRDFHQLEMFGADAVECEDGGDDEPYECLPSPVCWFREAGSKLCRVAQIAHAAALALLLLTTPQIEARADQAPAMTPLPTSTTEAPSQCCRMCKKGKPCGDGCINVERQCKKDQGCACSAADGS